MSTGRGTSLSNWGTYPESSHAINVGKVTGIHFSIPAEFDRRSWAAGWLSGQMGAYFVKMPCGRVYEFGLGIRELPLETMPCECGSEKEFVVGWSEEG